MNRSLQQVCRLSLFAMLAACAAAQQITPAGPGRPAGSGPAQQPAGAPALVPHPDAVPPGPMETRIWPCKHTLASELARVVREALSGRRVPLQMAVDERTNSILLTGDPAIGLPIAISLIEQLDRPAEIEPEPADAVQSISLSNADAREVMTSLHGLLGDEARPRALRIVADARGNAVWLAGHPRLVKRYAELTQIMDAAAGARRVDDRELRFYSLQHARSGRLQATLRGTAIMMGMDVPLTADEDSETLIAFATPTQHDVLAGIIKRLDVEPKQHPAGATEPARPRKPTP